MTESRNENRKKQPAGAWYANVILVITGVLLLGISIFIHDATVKSMLTVTGACCIGSVGTSFILDKILKRTIGNKPSREELEQRGI